MVVCCWCGGLFETISKRQQGSECDDARDYERALGGDRAFVYGKGQSAKLVEIMQERTRGVLSFSVVLINQRGQLWTDEGRNSLCYRARTMFVPRILSVVLVLCNGIHVAGSMQRHFGASTRCLVSAAAPNGWPMFASATELAADPTWGGYITSVYGEIPSSADLYPWCIGDQWLFFDSMIAKNNVTDIPPVTSSCPSNINKTLNQTGYEGQRYLVNNPLQPAGLTWSWHSAVPNDPWAPQLPIANNTWVEVMHRMVTTDEKSGAWLFYAPGSGIWINLGTTISFLSHGEAYQFFNATFVVNATTNNPLCVNNVNITTSNECMSHIAALQGYDSIQFMDTWPTTCTINKTVVMDANMNYEFVATKLQGMFACLSEDGLSPLVRSGWRGDRQCTCAFNGSSVHNLNCAEVPQ